MSAARAARSRLVACGAGALSNAELMAVLGASCVADSPRDVASENYYSLRAKHVPPAAAAALLAAVELGARVARDRGPSRPVFRTPEDSARYLLPIHSAHPVETFGLLALNIRHRLIREAVVSTGCLSSSLVHPREVFKPAVEARAAALILFHNHPSGDPEPSAEDVSLTRRLVSAGTLMGIDVVDHVILGAGRFVSLKHRGVV